jgi:uncharacterized membrane protein YgaE (UPF0421/DUF939 family)
MTELLEIRADIGFLNESRLLRFNRSFGCSLGLHLAILFLSRFGFNPIFRQGV